MHLSTVFTLAVTLMTGVYVQIPLQHATIII